MERLEMILIEFSKNSLDQFIKNDLNIQVDRIKSSHFYDNRSENDIEFQQIESLEEILSPKGTGNILLSQLNLGHTYNDVMIVISFDEESGDIVMNFPEEELFSGEKSETMLKAHKLIEYILDIKKKYAIEKVRIGYEPAMDDDTCLVEIDKEMMDTNVIVSKLLA
ncbi:MULTISPECIES: hypothetical protein [Paenibacillus]|uniref:hypothetical protein n=1 Tax=Paenibacillus TaxID=44249 RepID=UPI000B89FA9E|nr:MULTISPECIES: hypothetical protein [Paenibacillus]PRA02798.1 hypothetical protein CQ043_22215 [Paenibacillus sp. MYb63]PRA45605.1 hypothetical protein CQ061_22175 [Paenibacillus sp. MYb67]